MLPKSLRLKDASLFQKAFRGGKPFFFENTACKAIFIEGEPKRIGFAVSKKVFPRAVDRNRVKRALSDAVFELVSDIPDGFQMIFFPKNKDFLNKKTPREGILAIIESIKKSR